MEKYSWNFDDFFKNDNDFCKELEILKKDLDKFNDNLTSLSLSTMLEEYYKYSFRYEKLQTYTTLKYDVDMSNQKYLEYKNIVYEENSKLNKILNIIDEKIYEIDEPLDKYLEKNKELKAYKMHLYEVLRLKKHCNNEEYIQNATLMISKINDLYATIKNVELNYKEIDINNKKFKVTYQNFSKILTSKKKEDRKLAFYAYTDSLSMVNKSITGLLELRLKLCQDISKSKKYTSVLDQVLTESDLNINIINNLEKVINGNINLLERYFKLRRKSLNLSKLYPYDLDISNSYDKEISFEESINIVKDALSIMGRDYSNKLSKALESGILDAFPKKYKFTGSYHWRNYVKPMILMNYNNDYKSTYVLAHELGHAVNGIMVKEKQSYQDFHFSVFLSEIASKVNENILFNYLIRNASTKALKRYLIEQKLSGLVKDLFFSTMYLEFEENLYNIVSKNKALTADTINNIYYNLYKKYHPSIESTDNVKYLWQTRLHLFFHQYRYYNFQYATGTIVALKISNDIINSNNNMLEKYLHFLTIGGSMKTLDALEVLEINLDNKEIYIETMNYFNELLNEYEKL